ncbi:MAG: hypothetical protein U1F71_10045 [Verrucomicrobiaceae bacterium]
MRTFVAFLLPMLVSLATPHSSLGAPRHPNILFILADDMVWADLGCHGADLHETPRIEAFAKDIWDFVARQLRPSK